MVNKGSRVRILLTSKEFAQLASATTETGTSKSLLLVEAIQRDLRESDFFSIVQTRRLYRVDVRVPQELRDRIKQLAETHGLTQQSLLRSLLFQYLHDAPWKQEMETSRIEVVPRHQT